MKRAEEYSEKTGKSISQIVGDYFSLLDNDTNEETELHPAVKSLIGALGEKPLTKADYKKYLEEKNL
ncbi:antitoxin [Candidatus Roizmanbacteria bacterium]|nr:antitoxin [Candidatus Roizmanbacteria bacterium]